jgi:hypothetical protein
MHPEVVRGLGMFCLWHLRRQSTTDRLWVCLSPQSGLRALGATAALWGFTQERPPADR